MPDIPGLRILTVQAGDPKWVRELKDFLNRIVERLRIIPIVKGDGATTLVKDGSVTAVQQLVPVKVTGAKSGDYYPGDVFDNGIEEPASREDINIELVGFDVEIASPAVESYYWGSYVQEYEGTDFVYRVLLNIPLPPTADMYQLVSIDGVIQWLPVVDCAGDPV